MSCTATSPADPRVAHRHDMDRHTQRSIGRPDARGACQAPSSGRRRRRTRQRATLRRTVDGKLLEGQAQPRFVGRRSGPGSGSEMAWSSRPKPYFWMTGRRSAGTHRLAAANELVDRLRRLIGASRLMLRDSSIKKTAVGGGPGALHLLDADRVEQDQDQNAQRRGPQRDDRFARAVGWRAEAERQDHERHEAEGQEQDEANPVVMRM